MPEQRTISPFGLIADTELAAEVLILSYTAGLGFFERFALGAARATQARVTVIADATAVSADPAVVRGAGRTYLDGRAVCPCGSAFHPKLVVIAGTEHVAVAIGSGNLTLAGWHHNAELWTALYASAGTGPTALSRLAAFLRELTAAGVRLSHGAPEALRRVADRLDALPATEDVGTVVSSVFGPIIDQLPTGPVDELLLYAPFFDAELAAVDALVERFEPGQLTVCVQPTMTVVNGAKLRLLLARHGGTAASVKEERYRHGKLVEWRVGDEHFTLTGSPNLSRAALLRQLGGGGNCELGLITQVTESLAPPLGETLDGAALGALAFRRIDETVPAVVLLSGTATDEGLHLLLRDPLDGDGRLEVYDAGVWSDRISIPAAKTDLVIPAGEAGWLTGVAVRLRTMRGETSNEVFIADLSRVLRTSRPSAGRALTDGEEIFKDPKLFEQFLTDAQLLKPHLLPVAGTAGSVGADGHREPRTAGKPQSLEEYLDACESVLGERMLHFALGLPRLPGSGADALDTFTGGLEDDEEGEEAEDPNEASALVIPSFTVVTDYRRRRYQRWCVWLADLAPALVLIGRVLAVRLIARAAAGQLWADREEWAPVLARAARSLTAPGEAYDEERVAAASMAAVALAILHSQVHRFSEWDPVRSEYERTAQAFGPILELHDSTRIAEYGGELAEAFGPALAPESVENLLNELVNPPDPLDRAVYLLEEEYGLEANRRGRVIEYVDDLLGDPTWKLLLAIGVAEPALGIGAVGHTPRGRVMALWHPPHVLVLHEAAAGVWGRVHRLSVGMTPRLHAVAKEGLNDPEARWSVTELMPPEASSALIAAELNPAAPFDY